MRISTKLYLIVFMCAFIILVQYHIYNPWVIPALNNEEIQREDFSRKLQQVPCYNTATTDVSDLPPLYIITPTYRRPEQIAELTRLSHTLMLVPNLTWLVIEDAYKTNDLVEEILKKSGLKYQYMTAPMPAEYKNKTKGAKPRGVSNRNKGIEWIREHAKTGVLYFADDDNTYDLELFSDIRYTKRVSMFPVGLITKAGVSSPIVKHGVFAGFYDGWIGGRKFAVDMAGFAVSVEFLLKRPTAKMPFKPGFEEDGFLKSLSPFEPRDVELLASNCTKILVWHTQAKKNEPSLPLDMVKHNNTNLIMLKKILV
ncbi:galactosylgalactosylxylosylprotein 3-beta-glucuronosyltransferase P-like [Diorhabda sublineata]|uniref:galactosylgalactosylxylosylprotein 3-beta-glucuronosyltransferase P-like n=1 Tax=Diorhabda sublineata TaxID=1163346 RepID=UPI0024E13C91|nr:galactosylgalactosylxylosylprotein 3-beta-glucuronosyltransferase P-like [Diorhabda sublineata]XP_056645231.1 galactosylgalactosylxylosylprotein 3-beta-glucuronosyltransferase P-like [Diorhabda sublineata]XP_056645232.1 galactosylgalactosylxylosylprotein 3-beta-glucuronosyltransferase P-like [Diorhabda sublineata]XP_056645233.1 galactosylgalactosylxylosylprotein 3-beta-glucuronosyltransferase P-like [Diorhabda sublineata]